MKKFKEFLQESLKVVSKQSSGSNSNETKSFSSYFSDKPLKKDVSLKNSSGQIIKLKKGDKVTSHKNGIWVKVQDEAGIPPKELKSPSYDKVGITVQRTTENLNALIKGL